MTREVWFQLVDGEGNAVTLSADYTDCDDEAKVARLRDAVFSKVSRALPATAIASDLAVFVNQEAFDTKQALEEDSPIGTYGRAKRDALIVQVPQRALLSRRAVVLGVRGNVGRVGVQFATRELNHLLAKDAAQYNRLESPGLTAAEALLIRAFARAAIKSFTRRAIGIREGVLLDGPLNLSQGQAKSAFYYAYSRVGGVSAAKVYGERYRQDFQREVDVNLALGSHENIVQFLKSFSIANADNEQRHVIVMPFFARSAADLLRQQSPVELRALATIARDCVSALCHIHSKNYCFADLKPANIMLHCGERGGATLVDFGAAVKLGDPIVEATDEFCLDVAIVQGSELVDWTCLGTTLAQLAGIDITQFYSRQDLVMFLNDEDHSVDERVQQLIISCLMEPCRSRIEAALAPLLDAFCSVSVQAPEGC